MVVNGDVKLLGDVNNPNNRFEFLSNNQIPYRRGISIGDDNSSLQDGSFNLWIHGGQNNPAGSASFNFKNSFDNSSIFTIKQDFKVGIRTENPREALQIGDRFVIHNGNSKVIGYNFYYDGDNRKLVDGFSSGLYFSDNGDVSIRNAGNGNAGDFINWSNSLTINSLGSVAIGTSPQNNYKLVVDGKVGARELLLTAVSPWPDYVFENNYPLIPLEQKLTTIKLNKRLTDIDSAASIECNGIETYSVINALVKNLEELYLYVDQLNEKIKELEEK